jgi:hypothetical protein
LSMDIDGIFRKLETAGEDYADKESAASLLEETKKTLLAQLKTMSKASSDAAKETEAMASAGYKEHITNMVEARRQANRAKVRYEAMRVWVELKRTEAANERAAMMMR